MTSIRKQGMVSVLSTIVATAFAVASASALADPSSPAIANPRNNNEPLLRRLASKERDGEDLTDGAGGGAFVVDGAETVYDDFALAWRFLGFYTDCNVCLEDDDNKEGGGDNDEYVADVPSGCVVDNNGKDTTVCRRYALWAAYVDGGYEGGGADEYRYYDRSTRRWNGCDGGGGRKDDGDGRCVKMDCHDPYSRTFRLLGVFKDPKTDTFLESLIDYSGDCVWTDDEYKFMKAMNPGDDGDNNGQQQQQQQDYWPPAKCTAYQNEDDSTVYYYDAVPAAGGNLGVGLFRDDVCTVPVDDKKRKKKDRHAPTAEEILGRARGVSTGDHDEKKKNNNNRRHRDGKKHRRAIATAAADEMRAWNSAMDAFKVCQPCVSYDARLLFDDAEGTASAAHDKNGDRYDGDHKRSRKLEEAEAGNNGDEEEEEEEKGESEEDEGDFVCQDNLQRDEPVNQCRVLVQNGRNTMKAATYRDILRT